MAPRHSKKDRSQRFGNSADFRECGNGAASDFNYLAFPIPAFPAISGTRQAIEKHEVFTVPSSPTYLRKCRGAGNAPTTRIGEGG